MAIGQVAKVQLHACLQAPLQRQFIDTERRLAAVGGGRVVPGRIHVGATMGGDRQTLRRPRLVPRHLVEGQAREHRGHFRPTLLVIHVVDLGQQRRRVGVGVVVQRYREVDEAAFTGKGHGSRSQRVCSDARTRRGRWLRLRALRTRAWAEPS
ncbi:hypothetical protein D9M71_705090 [compost metagenome]